MRLQLSVAAALCVFSLAAHADTVYNYVGPDFQYFDGAYTATDNVTGSFTVANPIPPDYSGLVYTSAFSFNDGVQTISNANGHFINFNITTDANGNITYYMIRVTAADPLTFILLENQNTAFGDYGANFVYDEGTDNDPALGGASVYLPGEFTEVPAINSTPEPSSFACSARACSAWSVCCASALRRLRHTLAERAPASVGAFAFNAKSNGDITRH